MREPTPTARSRGEQKNVRGRQVKTGPIAMPRARLGVAGQSASFVRDEAKRVVQVTFTRPFAANPGDRLRFDECSSIDAAWSFDVVGVKGRRFVEVAPAEVPIETLTLNTGVAIAESKGEVGSATGASCADPPSDEGLETRSTDGSDTEGSLCDFIEHSDDDAEGGGAGVAEEGEEEEEELTPEAEVQQLVEEFPFDRALLAEEPAAADAPRRSRRTRAPVKRYVDANYETLMLEDVSDLSESDEEEAASDGGSDMQFESGEEEEADDDDESSFEGEA